MLNIGISVIKCSIFQFFKDSKMNNAALTESLEL